MPARCAKFPRTGFKMRLCIYLLLSSAQALSCSLAQSLGSPTPAIAVAVPTIEPRQQAVFAVPMSGSLTIGMGVSGCKEAEILIEAGEPRASFTILSPDAKEILSGKMERAGWLAISFPVSVDGLYQLVIHTVPEEEGQEGYLIRVELLTFSGTRGGKIADAEALYSRAEAQRNSLKASELRAAIAKYRQSTSLWHTAGDDEARVLGVAGEALARLELSDCKSADDLLDSAIGSLGTGSSSQYFHAWLLSLKAQVFLGKWDNVSAGVIAAEALKRARASHDTELQAEVLIGTGASGYLAHTKSAATDLDEAFRLAHESGSEDTMGLALRYKSWIEEDQGHLTRALLLMQQAAECFRKVGDGRNVLRAMAYIADIEGLEGDRYSALLRNYKLVSPMIESGNIEGYAAVEGNIGADYLALNRDQDAVPYLRRAVLAYRAMNSDAGESVYLGQLCMVELRQKKLDQALKDCHRSADLIKQTQDPKRLAITTWRLGKVAQALGQIDVALNDFKRAARISERVPDPRFESQALMDWSDSLVTSQKREDALPLLLKALSLSEEAEDSTVRLEAHFRIAHWYADSGEDPSALKELRTALDQIEEKRRTVQDDNLQASYFGAMRKCHDLYIDILMSQYTREPGSGADLRALEISESGLARTLLDSLAVHNGTLADTSNNDGARDLVRLRIAVDQAYDQRLKLLIEPGHLKDLTANAMQLTQSLSDLERAEDAKRPSVPGSKVFGHPLTADEIRTASKSSDTAFLEFALGKRRSYLWVIDGGEIRSIILPVAKARIESEVARWRKLAMVRASSFAEETFSDRLKRIDAADRKLPRLSAELSCMLRLDSINELRHKRLAIVPDGDLALLPFSSIPVNGCKTQNGPPLAFSHQIILVPSLSVYFSLKGPPKPTSFRGQVAVVADPVFDRDDARLHLANVHPSRQVPQKSFSNVAPELPRLLGTGFEAREIESLVGRKQTKLALGVDASIQTILDPALDNYRIWHLATHGVFDETTPQFSGLVFSLVSRDGRPVFGFLKAHDIASLHLHPELVVLSSCNSAAGEYVRGEGIMGLSYAFLHAGVRNVMFSLWAVDDVSSKEMMVNFYREMLKSGNSPAEALRLSQLKMMRQPGKSSPFFWAGFAINSDSE